MTSRSRSLSASSSERTLPSSSPRRSSYGGRAREDAIRVRFVAKWFNRRLRQAGWRSDHNCLTANRLILRIRLDKKWRRGELNPCPRRYPRKHLHVYPAKSSEEPSHAPAHCRLPSVHEIDSRTGAVAPPIRQPAVHVFAASRRHCENVTVN